MNRENSIASLPLASIKIDHSIQQRDKMLDNGIVSEYAEAMKAGSKFPPIIVYYDGTTYWLADGYHRVEAADEAGMKTIAAEIRPGSKRDAILYACGANRDHGLRRSREDVRRAIETMLKAAEWGQWSDRAIAELVGCDHKTVAAVRGQVGNFPTCDDDQPGDDPGDQVGKFPTSDEGQPGDADADQLGNFPSSTDQPTSDEGQPGDDPGDQVGKFPTSDEGQHTDDPGDRADKSASSLSSVVIEEIEGDDLGGIRRTAAELKGEASPPPAKRTGRDGKSYPTTSKRKAPTSPPPSAPKPQPTVNKAKVALDASLALAAAIVRLQPLVPDLLPEDSRRAYANLKGMLDLIEDNFGKGGKGHA